MDKFNEFLELLNSDKIMSEMYKYFFDREYEFTPKWRNQNKFVSYLKAYYVDRYNSVTDDLKEILLNGLKDGLLNYGVVESFISTINGSEAKQNDNIEGVSILEFKEVFSYKEDYLYDELSNDNEWIAGFIKESLGLITLKELKEGNYLVMDNYKLDKEEIKTIENAKLVRPYINVIHSLYDEFKDGLDERTVCNYSAIEDEVLRNLAFHTDRNNPEYDILFNDGTIINYYSGDIRIYPVNFMFIVEYIKCIFIENYYSNDEDSTFNYLANQYEIDTDVPFESMDEDLYESLFKIAIDMAEGTIYSLGQIYSKRMIEKSKVDIENMKKLVKKYKL